MRCKIVYAGNRNECFIYNNPYNLLNDGVYNSYIWIILIEF